MSHLDGPDPIPCSDGIAILKALDLANEGWQQRTVADPNRINEMERLYSELGYETFTTGLDPATFGEACTSCAITACATYVALFTRQKPVADLQAGAPNA